MTRAPTDVFIVAKNPDEASRLPYLVWLPVDGGLILKAKDTWPKTARVSLSTGTIASLLER